MCKSLYILLFFVVLNGYAQQETEKKLDNRMLLSDLPAEGFSEVVHSETIKVTDPYYREDQFYIGVTYNLLQSRPDGISQNTFSTGLHFGFLRDMPINKDRTYSIAAGLGFSINNLKQNLRISEIDGQIMYQPTPDDVKVNKNKLGLNYLELPIEFRWRTSTFDSHKFWRVYTGFKLSYLVSDRSKFVSGAIRETVRGNKDINSFQYGVYTAFGYNTWNFHIYYGLNPIFKSGTVNGQAIDLTTVNLGLMFYIL